MLHAVQAILGMIASLDFQVNCLFFCSLFSKYTRHITALYAIFFHSNFDPTFKVVPLKYMLIFFDLPSIHIINGHLPNHHHLHSNWIFACYNFLQYTYNTYTLFFTVEHCRAAHLIWFLFVIFFIDCYLLFCFGETFIFCRGVYVMVKVNKFTTKKKFFFSFTTPHVHQCNALTLLFLTVGKSFINHFPCVSSLYFALFSLLFRCFAVLCSAVLRHHSNGAKNSLV